MLRGRDASPDNPDQRRAPALVGVVWLLLVVNTLGSGGTGTIVPIPGPVAQAITMGSLVAAAALALVLNPRVRLRPNAYLLLLSLLLIVSVVASLRLESGGGALFRCGRLAVFITTLWLLTPWLNCGLSVVRHHIRALGAILVTVAIGLVAAPALAMPDTYGGRLVGAVWYLTPPQVGQYAAVVAGLTILLWLTRIASGTTTLWIAVPAVGMLLLSHTRTALLGLVVGLAIATLMLAITSARARRAMAVTALCAGTAALACWPIIQTWLRRGQDEEELSNLTGRQKVWDLLLAENRSPHQQLFGVGLTDKSFGGLPIDSTWLAVYHEQGLVGVTIVAMIFAVLISVAALRPPSPEKVCAVFLIGYCLVASYTEVGIGDASPYMLHLALATALLVRGDGSTAAIGSAPPGRVA